MQRPITRDEGLSHRGRVLRETVLRLRLVGMATPHRLAHGCAKLSSGTVRHRRSLNKAAISQRLQNCSNTSFFFCPPAFSFSSRREE